MKEVLADEEPWLKDDITNAILWGSFLVPIFSGIILAYEMGYFTSIN